MLMRSLNLLADQPLVASAKLLSFLLVSYLLFAEVRADEFRLVATHSHIKGFVGMDALGNYFGIENGEVVRYTSHALTSSYSNHQLGPVSMIDVSDPLNILVFFENFGNVVFLDKNLTGKSSIEGFSLYPPHIPSVVCMSSKHSFWAYFPDAFRFVNFSFRGVQGISSQDLNSNYPQMGQVKFMLENDDKLFIAANGIWVFDLHANHLFTIGHIHASRFQVKGNKIFYLAEDTLMIYDFFLDQENVFLLPEKGTKTFFIKNNNTLYLQTNDALKRYVYTGKLY